jgi:hypothetical protein
MKNAPKMINRNKAGLAARTTYRKGKKNITINKRGFCVA